MAGRSPFRFWGRLALAKTPVRDSAKRGVWEGLFGIEGLFLLVILAFRLAFIREVPLELSPDEAYYWDWSRNLAWGYYSKPPMVAWLIAASTHLLGISEYAVRLPAVFCGVGFLAFLYLLARELFGGVAARWALFAGAFIPIFTVYGLLMTIDPPLLFFWSGALYFGWRAAKTASKIYGFLLGVCVGLGLLSKQTMVAFGFFYTLWLWFYQPGFWRRAFFWVAVGTAFLLWLPNLYWIATHNWITLRHTESHFAEEGFFWMGPLRFFLEQAGVFSPFLWGLFVWGAWMFLRKPSWRSRPELGYLWFLSAAPFIAVLPLAFFRKINANWPLPFLIGALILSSGIVFSLRASPLRVRFLRGLFWLGVLTALGGSFLLYQLPRFPERFPPAVAGLLFRFYGWREAAHIVQRHRLPGEILLTNHRYLASELAFYLPDHPRVYQLPSREEKPESQYHLWGLPPDLKGKKALWVMKGQVQPKLDTKVDTLHFLGFYQISLPGERLLSLSLWRGRYY